MKQRIPESAVEEQILAYLWAIGCVAWKNPTAGYFDTKTQRFRKHKSKYAINGVSDILGTTPSGRTLAIEVKSPQNKERPEHQASFLDWINKNNGIAFFASTLEEVKFNLGWRDPELEQLILKSA